jgi:hypothetical protein
MDDNIFDEESIKKRIEVLQNRNIRHFQIPHLYQCITDFMKTEKGKAVVWDYIVKNDALDYDLIDEILDYQTNNKKQ